MKTFIHVKTEELFKRIKFDSETRKQIKAELLERAEGTFLWVGLAMLELSKEDTELGVRNTLKD